MKGRILIVDDEQAFGETLRLDLTRRGYEATWVSNPADALDRLEQGAADVLVADVHLRGEIDGLELSRRAALSAPDVPVIVITGFGSLDTAIQAIRAGAYDFVAKPFETEQLLLAVDRALSHRQLKSEVKRLRSEAKEAPHFDLLLGDSPPMRKLFALLERVADADAAVLITGESGSGKEVVARALHARSRRASGPFLTVSCGAVPEQLLEAELFGQAKGADGREARAGLFQRAHGGTLFFDEIGELPLALQAKLLRVLQERVVRPVGGEQEVPVDVRVMAATNRDLEAAVEERRFREDLYFRVNVIQVQVPPLRARGGDALLLAQHSLERFAQRAGKSVVGISPPAAEKLLAYAWPGNVRELQNAVERAVALTRFEQLTVDDLPERIREHKPSHLVVASEDPNDLVTMEEVEKRYILRVLEAVGGHRTQASRILGLDRKTLYRKLERYQEESGGELQIPASR